MRNVSLPKSFCRLTKLWVLLTQRVRTKTGLTRSDCEGLSVWHLTRLWICYSADIQRQNNLFKYLQVCVCLRSVFASMTLRRLGHVQSFKLPSWKPARVPRMVRDSLDLQISSRPGRSDQSRWSLQPQLRSFGWGFCCCTTSMSSAGTSRGSRMRYGATFLTQELMLFVLQSEFGKLCNQKFQQSWQSVFEGASTHTGENSALHAVQPRITLSPTLNLKQGPQ